MSTRVNSGSAEYRAAINRDSDSELIVANSVALDPRKGVSILQGAAGLTGLTLAAPSADQLGQDKVIANIAAQTAALVITGMAFATQDSLTFAVASATVIGPSLHLRVIDTTPGAAAGPTPKWLVIGAAGFVAGTTAVA